MYHRHAYRENQTNSGFHRDDPWLVLTQKVYRQGANLQHQPGAPGRQAGRGERPERHRERYQETAVRPPRGVLTTFQASPSFSMARIIQ